LVSQAQFLEGFTSGPQDFSSPERLTWGHLQFLIREPGNILSHAYVRSFPPPLKTIFTYSHLKVVDGFFLTELFWALIGLV